MVSILDMTEWKIKLQDEDEDEEVFEEGSEESEPLENILEGTSSSPSFHSNKQDISPFLESEPIENLEQDLSQVPNTTENKEKNNEIEQPELYNAPQYSGSYNSGDYENMGKADTELDISRGSLMTRETGITPGFERRMDINAWQQQNMDQVQTQGEKYQVGKPEKFKQDEGLPFQNKKDPRGFG